MARFEEPREDLLAEATALVDRAEFRVPGESLPYVVGFRRNGALSLYCGEDPVYQFNADGELRRGFWRGCLLRAEDGCLIQLKRQRDGHTVTLLRRTLLDGDVAEYMGDFQQRLEVIVRAIRGGTVELVGQVPQDGNVLGRLAAWADTLPMPVVIAEQPGVGQ